MNDSPISRGFSGRRRADANAKHIPPGQHLTSDFPVLSAGPTPEPDFENWQFQLGDGDAELGSWDWTQFGVLTQTDITTDIHCVTSWSKLDTRWRGVTIDTLLDAVGLTEPPSPFAIISCEGGYTTNLPSEDLIDGKAMIATHFDGQPLSPEHGGPARLLVPHLYFWKSAKWVRAIEFRDADEPGFWEQLGYHNYGDPWREQRYDGD